MPGSSILQSALHLCNKRRDSACRQPWNGGAECEQNPTGEHVVAWCLSVRLCYLDWCAAHLVCIQVVPFEKKYIVFGVFNVKTGNSTLSAIWILYTDSTVLVIIKLNCHCAIFFWTSGHISGVHSLWKEHGHDWIRENLFFAGVHQLHSGVVVSTVASQKEGF